MTRTQRIVHSCKMLHRVKQFSSVVICACLKVRMADKEIVIPWVYIFPPSGALFSKLTSFGFQMLVNSWSKGFHICFAHVHNSYDF